MHNFSNIHIVLVDTSHPGNIGAVARAMKNMGLLQLRLVRPKQFPHQIASERASGADDILQKVTVFNDLSAALQDCNIVYGASSRSRMLPWPLMDARACAQRVRQDMTQATVAIVFGSEKFGLSNDELAMCNYHVNIPANPDYLSLNLACAVQVLSYEIRMAALQGEVESNTAEVASVIELATVQDTEGLFSHFEEVMRALDILDPNHPKLLMRRLRRLFLRAHLEKTEINILRGMLKAVQRKCNF